MTDDEQLNAANAQLRALFSEPAAPPPHDFTMPYYSGAQLDAIRALLAGGDVAGAQRAILATANEPKES